MRARSWGAVVLGLGALSEVFYFLYKRQAHLTLWRHLVGVTQSASSASNSSLGSREQETSDEAIFHQVLFFPDAERICPEHFLTGQGCHRPKCPFSHRTTNFSRMAGHLLGARRTLDVCVYTISNGDLADMVVTLHGRGVVVRVITDDEALNLAGTYIGRFRRAGIPVRRDYSSYLMHHKFAIVDGTTLLTGSFNWTSHAINSNNENLLVTNNPEIVRPFVAEYERLWEVFDPAKRPR